MNDTRRCTSEACRLAVRKNTTIDMPVANILDNPQGDWRQISMGNSRIAKRVIDVDWKQFNKDNYLFTSCAIVCSVNVASNGYYIDPVCSDLINNNGNAWTTGVLLATYRSFIGAQNYLEHLQVPSESKGRILDAVARPVIHQNDIGKAEVIWVDILVATDRKHCDLVREIESGELNTMSMGSTVMGCQCSKCGNVTHDDDKNCEHIEHQLRSYFTDENGIQRRVAELCGTSKKVNGVWVPDPKSNKFIEASWVRRPAFSGAVLNHFISDMPKTTHLMNMKTSSLDEAVSDLFNLRVADTSGMMVLRIAKEELRRRKKEEMISRIARKHLINLRSQ